MLKKPSMFESKYALGFSTERLTPAWAARFITRLKLFFSKFSSFFGNFQFQEGKRKS